jgi:hypothetical protein
MRMVRPRSIVVAVVGLLLLAAWGSAEAQMAKASAEASRVNGRVEYQQRGQTAWPPLTVGTRLVEGDQVRAMAGGEAQLELPDGSTILIAENTRFAVTKLDYDGQTRDRDASFHVVAGKVRAQVSQAAVSLVRARQSNFNISTPNGVAAVRGTIVVSAYNPATRETLTFVFPSPGQSPGSARVTLADRSGNAVTVVAGNYVRAVGGVMGQPTPTSTLPAAVQQALQTAQNQSTAGANELTAISVVIPTSQETQNIVNTATGGTGGGPTPVAGGPGTTTGGPPSGCSDCSGPNPMTPPPPPPPTRDCATPPCEEGGGGSPLRRR